MPHCYLLAVCTGSSVDQQTNNATLFNMVEQIHVPAGTPPPPLNIVPLEVHVYWLFEGREISRDFEIRIVMRSKETNLETSGDPIQHRAISSRLRTRLQGLPFPPVPGTYELCVDWRPEGSDHWSREPLKWPLTITDETPKPRVTH
jgi:hypothetical protein